MTAGNTRHVRIRLTTIESSSWPWRTTATIREAVLAGIAPDGGLWLPDPLPRFDDWPELLELDWGRKLARATTLPIEVRPFQGETRD